jgi:DNA repair protein RecO (recombination protein O)
MTRDRAICLRRIDYSETSQILSIFTREHGILRVIAKGAKRTTKAGSSKFDGGLDLLDAGEAVFLHSPEKDLSTLTEWTLTDGHLPLRGVLRGMYLAQYAAELVGALLHEHDPHPDVYEDLEGVLPALATDRAEEAFLAFEVRALYASGLFPELNLCGRCGRALDEREAVVFSASAGGFLCGTCGTPQPGAVVERGQPDARPVDGRTVGLLRRLATGVLPAQYGGARLPLRAGGGLRLPRVARAVSDPANRLLGEHVRHATGKELRMWSYVMGDGAPRGEGVPRGEGLPSASLPDGEGLPIGPRSV